jgi:phosphate transport system substrate-binding protein
MVAMQRREFLAALATAFGGLAAGFGLAAAARSIDPGTASIAGSFCRVSTPILPARGPGLTYQGTHILTYGALREIAETYQKLTGAPCRIYGGGCDDGITAVQRAQAHLGGLCCPVEGSRAEGLPWLPVARDLKAVVVNPAVPVDDIPFEALQDLARGRLRNWQAVGGHRRAVALVVRRHCEDYQEPVETQLTGPRDAWSRQAIFVNTDLELVDTVSRFQAGVGVVSWVFAEPLVSAGRLRLLAVEGAEASLEELAAGRYPLEGPLNLIYSEWHDDLMRPFLDFLYSPAGQAITARFLVPLDAPNGGYPVLAA